MQMPGKHHAKQPARCGPMCSCTDKIKRSSQYILTSSQGTFFLFHTTASCANITKQPSTIPQSNGARPQKAFRFNGVPAEEVSSSASHSGSNGDICSRAQPSRGGVWQDTQDGHLAGDLILRDTHYHRYLAFYYCNATAFAASLVVCLLLLVLGSKTKAWAAALRVVMVLDLLGLMGAYAAGSCRDVFTTIYSSVIMSAIFTYIAIAIFVYVYSVKQDEDTAKHKRDDQHEVLMLLATFVATITYVAGLNPPGGFWSNAEYGHHVSDPILQDHNSSRYQAFFVCNTTAFVSSLLIIMLLLDKNLIISLPAKKLKSVWFVALYGFIVVALIGLVGAYAAGSCRELDTTTYVVCLIGAVLAYIFLQVAITRAIIENAPAWLQKIRKLFVEPKRDNEAKAAAQKKPRANDALEKARNLVILLATHVASITYQAGLDPPGGLWPDDQDGHKAGDPVLLTTHPTRYKASHTVLCTLRLCMVAGMFGLMGAYAAGSSRQLRTSIYVLTLVAAVFAVVILQVVIFWIRNSKNKTPGQVGSSSSNVSPDPANGPYEQGVGSVESSEIRSHNTDIESAEHLKQKMEKELQDEEENGEVKRKKDMREYLMLLGVLAASVTYQTGLKPPGGLWQENNNGHSSSGNSVLHDINKRRYHAFFYSNSTSFMASIVVVVLLLPRTLHNHKLLLWPMHTAILLNMLGLLGAYAAGSTRDLATSRNVICLVIPVLVYIAAYEAWSFYQRNTKVTKEILHQPISDEQS